jgi:cyclophilin family peptidyl-prolyl cis-trans isomerase
MAMVSRRSKRTNVRSIATAAGRGIERLESRQLFAATVIAPIPTQFGTAGGAASTLDVTDFVADPANESTVEMVTSTGTVQIQTFDQEVPINAGAFLKYVKRGLYNNAIFHRSVITPTPFVLQGGGSYVNGTDVPSLGTINSEPNGPRHNRRGTLAFARVGPENGGGPDSATNEFFFNLADNSTNLDAQNGGFTVFGEVQGAGMTVIDALSQIANANSRVITSARVIPDMTYQVSSSDPSQVTASVDANGIVSLSFASGTSTATITVIGTDLSSGSAQTTFQASAGLQISIGGSTGNKSVSYTQSDGTQTTVSMKGNGTGVLTLNGVSLSQTVSKGKVAVTGEAAATSLVVTGTDAKTSLTISTKGGTGVSNLGGLTTDGAVKSISGKRVRLTGAMAVAGAASSIALGDITGTSLTVGGSAADKAMTLSLGTLTNASIVAGSPIKSLKVVSAVNTDTTADNISAAGITSVSSSGDFAATVNLSGENNLRSMKVGGNLTGNVTAHQIGTISVKGDASGVLITATHGASEVVTAGGNPDSKGNQGIQSVKVGGTINGSTISTGATIGSVSSAAVTGALVVAGAPNISAIPTQPSDIPEPASILSFKTKAFSSSFVIARNLGKISAGTIAINNNTNQFGFFGDTIGSLSATTNGTPAQKINVKKPADQTAVDADLTGATLGDFAVRAL